MENKINIAELLKDCPKGMELDCTMIDNVVFEKLDFISSHHPIIIRKTDSNKTIHLTKYGQYSDEEGYKCVIFPKGKTTWEGFVPPCEFKDGDILCNSKTKQPFILKFFDLLNNNVHSYCGIDGSNKFYTSSNNWAYASDVRLATKEEKERLFDAIKENGYKWNEETKTLDKLIEPKFHEGEWVVTDYGEVNQVITVSEDGEGFTLDDGSYFSGSWKDMYHLWTIQDAKDGDVLCDYHEEYNKRLIFILKKFEHVNFGLVKPSDYSSYCFISAGDGHRFKEGTYHHSHNIKPATKEQRDFLFQKMKEAGYKWDKETKTLNKLVEPKFKVGDRITSKVLISGINTITKVCEDHYELDDGCTLKIDYQDNWELINKPKFKVGDKVRGKYTNNIYTISRITPTGYELTNGQSFTFDAEICHELVSENFDFSKLVPFESKVLVRNDTEQRWIPAFWGGKREDGYVTTFGWSKYCVPYEGNEHLLDKTDDCDEYYKTWE